MQNEDKIVFDEIKQQNYKNVAILGGLGFVGQYFFEYIYGLDLFDKIYILDKKLMMMAYVKETSKLLYQDQNRVQIIQMDLSQEIQVRQFFNEHSNIDIIINLAGASNFSEQVEQSSMIFKVTSQCYKLSMEFKVRKYIEISTAYVYQSSKVPSNEESKINPIYQLAFQKLKCEQFILKENKNSTINVVILRPSIIYGDGIFQAFSKLFAIASIYKQNQEKLMLLWDGSLKINTIHCMDLCRSIMYSISRGNLTNNLDIFNVSDSNNTDYNMVVNLMQKVFKINIQFYGYYQTLAMSYFLPNALEAFNSKNLQCWLKLLQLYKVDSSPINILIPFKQVQNYDLCIDGRKLQQKLQFKYTHQKITDYDIAQQLNALIDLKIFPNQFKIL